MRTHACMACSKLKSPVQMNIASMAPITATQFGTAKLVQSLVLPEGEEPGAVLRIGSALIAGAASGLVATPFEMIVIHQQVRAWARMLHASC
jgi:hypothetical protein